jgi:hypothetical protein
MLAGDNYPDGQCGRHAVCTLVAANISAINNGAPFLIEAAQLKNITFPWA